MAFSHLTVAKIALSLARLRSICTSATSSVKLMQSVSDQMLNKFKRLSTCC